MVANALNQVEPRQAKLKIRQVVIKEKQVPLVKKSSTEAPTRKLKKLAPEQVGRPTPQRRSGCKKRKLPKSARSASRRNGSRRRRPRKRQKTSWPIRSA